MVLKKNWSILQAPIWAPISRLIICHLSFVIFKRIDHSTPLLLCPSAPLPLELLQFSQDAQDEIVIA